MVRPYLSKIYFSASLASSSLKLFSPVTGFAMKLPGEVLHFRFEAAELPDYWIELHKTAKLPDRQ